MSRGENLQIGTYDGKPLTTELSGNVIDVCPVGALTNKVFRFKARAVGTDRARIARLPRRAGLQPVPAHAPRRSRCAPCRATTKRSTSAGCRTATAIRTRACTPPTARPRPLVREGDGWREASVGRSAGQGREDPARQRRRPARRARASGDLERGGRAARRASPKRWAPATSTIASAQQDLSDAAVAEAFAMPVADIEKADAIVIVGSQPAPRSAAAAPAPAQGVASAARRCTWSIRSISTSPSTSPASRIVPPSQLADALADAGLRDALKRSRARRDRRRRRREQRACRARSAPAARDFAHGDRRRALPHPAGRQCGRPGAARRAADARAMRRRCSPMRAAAYVLYGIEPGLDFADQRAGAARRWRRRRSSPSATSPASPRAPSPT